MVLFDNILELKKLKSGLWERLKPINEGLDDSPVKLLETRSGAPTLAVEIDGALTFIHSKYDPVKEAQGFVDKMDEKEVAKYDHVFFYGMGLGYLFEAFMERFPGKFFSIYEPSADVFCHHLSRKLIKRFPLRKIKYLFVDTTEDEAEYNATKFFNTVYEQVLFVTLPSYERIFPEDFERFSKHFVFSIKSTLSNRATAKNFQNLWTINSMINFGENLNNNTIFNCDRKHFKGKPAILAAAGPSLAPELENLRRIRDEGLAYVFSVGSANRLLVQNDIFPHVSASMDPQAENTDVFQEVIDRQIEDIVLLYGTSVGHDTVTRYPGPKLFMMMDKDNVTPYFLPVSSRSTVKMVGDAPTIAITTLQALILLGFDPIILVGQNLAFLDNQYYAEGISYATQGTHIKENQFIQETVENVDGEDVSTFHAWILSRKIMENLIASAPRVSFLNATKRGAKIDGARFVPLDEIMKEHLTERVVDEDWYKAEAKFFDIEHLAKQDKRMRTAQVQLIQRFDNCTHILDRLKEIAPYNRSKQIEQELTAFNKCFDEIINNDYFKVFINPMLMIENQILQNSLAKIRSEKNLSHRAKYVAEEFGRLIREAKFDMNRYAEPQYKKISLDIAEYIKNVKSLNTQDETESVE